MPGHCLQGDVEGGRQLGHEQGLATEPLQDRAPYRIREREENPIEQRLVGIGALVEQRHDLCAARHGRKIINRSVDRLIISRDWPGALSRRTAAVPGPVRAAAAPAREGRACGPHRVPGATSCSTSWPGWRRA